MKKTYFHKLGRIGGQKTSSYYLTLPRELMDELGWEKGRIITIRKVGQRLQLDGYGAKTKK